MCMVSGGLSVARREAIGHTPGGCLVTPNENMGRTSLETRRESRQMNGEFEQHIETLHELIEGADHLGLFEKTDEDDEKRDYKQELYDLVDAVEVSIHEPSPSIIRNRVRREHNELGWTIEQFFEAAAEDQECRDPNIAISAMGEVLYDIRNGDVTEEDVRGELFGKFMSAAYATAWCLAFFEAKPALAVATA